MKKLITLLFLLVQFISFTQTYGNEWINYSQKYYSFKIVNEGIYKIDYETLVADGIDPTQFSASNIQLFGRNKELPIYVYDGGNDSLNPGDYFIFYAQKNDGWLDSSLYIDPSYIGNPGYSLFNDTIHYFFTWNNSNNNLRFIYESYEGYQSYPISPYAIDYQIFSPTTAFNPGRVSFVDASSLFDPGEGYCIGSIEGGGTTSGGLWTNTFDLTNIYTSGSVTPPSCKFHFKGSSLNSAAASQGQSNNHHMRLSFGNTQIHDNKFSGYQQIIFDTFLSPSFLSTNNTFKFEVINDLNVATDLQTVNYISIRYPKQFKLNWANNDKFEIINNPDNNIFKIRMDITNTSITNPIVLVLGQRPKFVNVLKSNDTIYTLVSKSFNGENQELVIQDLSLLKTVDSLSPVNGTATFTDFESTSIDYNNANIIIYNKKFGAPDVNGSAVKNYIDYRSQSYNVVTANIEELYLQFGGGIQKHSNAIRKFAQFAYNRSTSKPLAITILGKGMRYDKSRSNNTNFQNSLIPPFGSPGSDIFYTSFLQGNTYAPLIPIGRISVTSEEDLQDYLNKLIEYENQQDQSSVYNSETKDWQKQVLHFVGGNPDQIGTFATYMKNFEKCIEDTLFGGNVTTILKHTSGPLDPSLVGEISNYIEYGASIMNFFGHSGSTGFDITLDDPTQWNNQGKYPFIVGNGCHAAAIFESNDYYFSEKIVATANAGGIAYLASGASEYDITVKHYCGELYHQISHEEYGQTLGLQIKETIAHLQDSFINNLYFHSTFGATNLNGDPLLRVNYHNKPEIELLDQNVTFNPNTITLDVDSINVEVILTNLGRSVTDTFLLNLNRDFPLAQLDSSYSIKIPRLHYKDTFTFSIPLQPDISLGVNNFDIKADIPSRISEQYDEINNNQIVKNFYLKIDGILPVLPYQYAVVPDSLVDVVASTINPIAGTRTYYFELDTTDLFNSPQLRRKTIVGPGGTQIVKWNEWRNASNTADFPLICPDSMVYFWRVAIDSSTISWSESSFQYIKNKAGWGQDHFFQYKNNSFINIDYERSERLRKFQLKTAIYTNTVWDHAQTNDQVYQTQFNINGVDGDYGFCGWTPSIHLVIIDPITLKPLHNNCHDIDDGIIDGYSFGQTNDNCACRWWRSENFFIFRQDSAQLNLLYNVLTNPQFEGYYFGIYTTVSPLFENWIQYAPQLFTWFNQHGSALINDTAQNLAFSFFTQVGNNALTQEIQASQLNEYITLNASLMGSNTIGYEKSTLIGPAKEWKTVYWKQSSLDNPISDSTRLRIIGYDATLTSDFIVDREFTSNDSILNFNSLIDASVYPYLKLEAYYIDSANSTPAQIDRWHVLYSPVPEAAIDNHRKYTLEPSLDTIKEGQQFIFAADYKNISSLDMDSMLVRYWIEDESHNRHYINYPRQDSLLVGETFRDTITVNTVGLPGLNSLWMEINPYIDGNMMVTDQLEQHHFNNILQIPFYVKGDDVNPILDVSFDGRRILNGDIINPKSEIVITLKDDNPYLIMDNVSDTTLFGVFLTEPGGEQKRIPFVSGNGETIMQWIPADGQNKKFKIIYNTNFVKDGIYTLWVQGSDKSGNLSGEIQYRVTFEVINESTITHLMNYPNPFSTSTRFVFTLTGSEKPDDIIIQIMTITGKVVREITENEIGPIYIGRNITQFAWNGTDEFGDALANGVYLYRVLSRINGEEIKLRESGADQYFKKEFGKMYLMR